jgi:hypothetical protein
MYKPVMEIISETIRDNFDSLVMKAVHEIGVEVDKEELIRALKYDRDQYEKGFRDGVVSVREWIPVEEGLPEDDRNVLVCSAKGAVLIAHYNHYWKYWSGFSNIKVTHWMSLPEPPKGVE